MSAFLEHFRFGAPWWLLLLCVLPALAFLNKRSGTPSSIVFSSLSVLASLGRKPNRLAGKLAGWILLSSLAVSIIAMARPQWTNTTVTRSASGIDIMLAIDVSGSMEYDDFRISSRRAQRLEVAKIVAAQFVEQRPDDRIGIVAFSGRPYVKSPITLDHEYIIDSLQSLRTREILEDGTAVGSAVAAAATRLADREAKSKIIVLLTDGESNSGKITPEKSAELAAELGIKVYTIGIGTEGGRARRGSGFRQQQDFDVKSLQEIARITGAEFYRANDTNALVDVFSTINDLERTTIERNESISIDELFQPFLIVAFALGLIGLSIVTFTPPPAP